MQRGLIVIAAVLLLAAPAQAREPLEGQGVTRTEGAVIKRVSDAPVIEVRDVDSRGVAVRVLVEQANGAVAAVVLFAGGRGATRVSSEGRIGQLAGNFLIRSRHLFWPQGVATVVFDSPSDEEDDLRWFQDSEEFAADVGAVIRHLRATLKLPLWLVGTSRGTVSVANAASRLREGGPDGAVFSSTLFRSGRFSGVFDLDLEAIALPVLIVHHREDACDYTLPGEVPAFRAKLTHANPVKLLWYEGGAARGDPCQARHYHGFNAIEDRVIADIAAWIKNPKP